MKNGNLSELRCGWHGLLEGSWAIGGTEQPRTWDGSAKSCDYGWLPGTTHAEVCAAHAHDDDGHGAG